MSDPSIASVAEPRREERTWALVAHLGGPAGLLLSAGLFGFAVPLVVWLARRDDSPFAGEHAKEALNFQLTLFFLHLAAWVFVLFTLGLGLLVVLPFFFVLWFFELILGIVAALKANAGERYRYPLTLRMIG
jgi:uncharacterized Tic20 family protein